MAPATTTSLKNVAIIAVLIFSMMSMFLLYQHELHSMQRDAAGLNQSYKRLRKIGRLISKTVQTYVHIPDLDEIHNGTHHISLRIDDDTPEATDDNQGWSKVKV